MLAPPIINILTAGGFGLRLENDRLIVHPASDLTASLRAMIREHKPALVGYLRQMQAPANDPAPAGPSHRWLIRHADGRLISHSYTPHPASREEVSAEYPDAVSIEPEDEDDE